MAFVVPLQITDIFIFSSSLSNFNYFLQISIQIGIVITFNVNILIF